MHERTAVQALRHALSDDVWGILLADRGLGDTKVFDHLLEIPGFDFIIRFKKCHLITAAGYVGKAEDAVFNNGRIRACSGTRCSPETIVDLTPWFSTRPAR